MTIDLGNVNNGIPMGSYVGGGGEDATAYHFKGSVDTYADLTAIINPSQGDVYDVKETGMNYAWTGTEWDELGGTVDLSGYYDKTEVNSKLSQKEDVITPIGPIYKTQRSQSPLTGFSYTADNTGIYSANGWGTGVYQSGSGTNGIIDVGDYAYDNSGDLFPWRPESLKNYIAIPYSIGQVLKYPSFKQYQQTVLLGHFDEIGTFRPITMLYYGGPFHLIMSDADPIKYDVNSYGAKRARWNCPGYRLEPTSGSTSWAISNGGTAAYFQLFKNEDGTIGFGASSCDTTGGSRFNYYRESFYNTTEMIERVEQITTALILPLYEPTNNWTYSYGRTTSDAFLLSNIGLYDNPGFLGRDITDMQLLGNNKFEIDTPTVANYLGINIGDGLSVVDGKLTVPGNVPDNMVTTDTEQTISGVKTFSAGIKGNGYINNIGLTDLIYTDVNKNPHVGNVSRTLTIHTNPIGNGRILVNDGSSNYEDLHTGNIANFIDGTSITFTNNKLSATGGGETDAYTKAETDELLGEKADKFTTSAPLIISEKSDAEYDGTIANGTISFDGVNSFTTISDVLYAGAHNGDRITRYVALPLDVNTIVKAPIMGKFNNTSEYGQIREQVLLGDFDNEGKFIPYVGILNERRSNNYYGRMNGGATISNINPNGAYGLAFTYTSPSSHDHAAYNLETATPDDAPIESQSIYVEKYIDSTGVLSMGVWTVGDVDGSSIQNMVSTTFDGSIGAELQEACKKSKWVLISPEGNSLTPNIGDFKIYETNGRHGWDKAGLLSGITNAPYKQPLVSSTANIALSVDNSTIKVNDNGQLYAIAQESPAPSNMVTTDTEQNITGTKTFINDMFLPGIIVQDSSGGSAATIAPGSIGVSRLHVDGTGYLTADSTGVILGDTSLQQVVLRGEKVQCYDPAGNKDILHTGNAFKQVKLTQAEYDALTTKDENTIYIIVG